MQWEILTAHLKDNNNLMSNSSCCCSVYFSAIASINNNGSSTNSRMEPRRSRCAPNDSASTRPASTPWQNGRTRFIFYFLFIIVVAFKIHLTSIGFDLDSYSKGRKFAVKPNSNKKVVTDNNEIAVN